MRQRTWVILSVIEIIAILAVIGVSVGMGGCTKMIECVSGSVPMKCHWTFVATTVTSVGALLIAGAALFTKTREGRLVGAFATLVALGATLFITTPLGIGICSSPEMHCHQTAPVLWAAAGIGCVLALIQLIMANPDKADLPKMRV